MLAELKESLAQFDAVTVGGAEAKAAHVRASAELRTLANEVFQAVQVLDRFNRLRFKQSPELLAAWRSISNVVARPRPKAEPEAGPGDGAAPPVTGAERPAA